MSFLNKNNFFQSTVFLLLFSSLIGCDKNLSKSNAQKIIEEKYKFPIAEESYLSKPNFNIWVPECDGCEPAKDFDKVIKSEKYSSLDGFNMGWNLNGEFYDKNGVYHFNTPNEPQRIQNNILWPAYRKTYLLEGDIDLYKKYRDLKLIQFDSYYINSSGSFQDNSPYRSIKGNLWNCTFSMTNYAKELGVDNWKYKDSEWVFDEITSLFNDEVNKIADVEYTIKTKNPTKMSQIMGNWTEKKETRKVRFKLYDDGWKIEN